MDRNIAFEQRIKDALEQFEVPYNSADWAQMERTLDATERSGRWGGSAWIAGLAGVGLLTATLMYFLLRPDLTPIGSTEIPIVQRMDAPFEKPGPVTPKATQDGGANVLEPTPARSITTPALSNEEAPPQNSKKNVESGSNDHPEISAIVVKRADGTIERTTIGGPAGPPHPTPKNTTELTFRSSTTEGCPGSTIKFNVDNMPENGIYLWNFGDGSFSNKPDPEHTFAKSGKFEVMLSLSNSGGGNIRNKPSSDLIVIHEAPAAKFNALKQDFAGHIPSVHFENRSEGGANYFWDFGDGTTSTIAHPDHVFRKQGVYHVELSVTNENGCVDQSMRDVRIEKDYNLDAPGSFSPNGDGIDELFMPEALRTLGVRFHLAIHDATTGRKVYETTDASKPWTGRYDNKGELCPAGDYVWMVEINEAAHLGDITYDGKVSLVR
ncbi:MAG: PKD domain-containing protein [Flavobacteriales bacterium]|nr:PKD domain-containing protein [Flavobacteriales bacterium]MCB9167684.1 PKD domain-containing protein [Flavobacteriales bacterium]